ISDVAIPIIKHGICIIIGAYILNSMYYIAIHPEVMGDEPTFTNFITVFGGIFGWVVGTIVVVLGATVCGARLIEYIGKIKIAKCKIRAMENNDAEDVK
ncbi:MAG: hypothetical protein KAJ03_00975, partial [Gammaproteobacteria bacterium]|nr:hypothetical protein [Gammaproteobacteria bacterium]